MATGRRSEYKQYLRDNSITVPRTTVYNHRKQESGYSSYNEGMLTQTSEHGSEREYERDDNNLDSSSWSSDLEVS